MRARIACAVVCLGASALLSGCLERELAKVNPCLTTSLTRTVHVQNIDKVDLLFVVDNSGSMAEEQAALRREFPKLITTLTSGVRADGSTFTPVRDLHLGVVSTDIGTAGLAPGNCAGPGDDGILQHISNPAMDPELASDCAAHENALPSFLSFVPEENDPARVAQAFQCIATLGTEGCGFEQQLEAMLKAVTPAVLPASSEGDAQILFIGGDGALTPGHGDGANAGFLRNDPGADRSLLAIVVVTDEEDCSSSNPEHFNLGDGEKRHELRCFLNKDNLYPIAQRYFNALRLLRPEENLLIFAAIVGVPQDLVDVAAQRLVDWEDEASVAAYYDGMLNHPRMQERINAEGDGLEPSCTNTVDGEQQDAYPPRRIVELAKHFGKNGVVQSICQDSFEPAIDALIDAIARNVGNVCLPRTLVPNAEGVVEGCEVLWELPKVALPHSITNCSELPYLTPSVGLGGELRCVVDQVPVRDGAPVAGMNGWYYDDFSNELQELCRDQPRRIAFTEPPPSGVTVKLDCGKDFALPPKPTDANPRVEQPSFGTDCRAPDGSADDARCVETLSNGERVQRMRCHQSDNVCVLPCSGKQDCPGAWVCDGRAHTTSRAGMPICVNPTCTEDT